MSATTKKNFVEIDLIVKDERVEFTVRNGKPVTNKSDIATTSRLGLKNVKRRLQILYPNKHKLTINDLDETFSIYLELEI